jgi:hypothetical protein
MGRGEIKIVATKILNLIISSNPVMGIPIIKYFTFFIVEQVLLATYKNIDLYLELAKVESITTDQRKTLEISKLEYQIAKVKGDPDEIKIYQEKFKTTFHNFINLRM